MNPDVEKFVVNLKKKYKGRLVNREKQWPPRNSSKLVRLQLVNKRKEELSSTSTQEDRDEYVLSQLSLSDHYVYLCMFDDSYVVQRSKEEVHTPLAYCNLFEGENGKAEPVKKVLIEGGAGIGKTTLTISLSEDWACDKLFQTFDILLLLPLRHEKVASAGTLSELLNLLHSGPDTCQSVASYLEEEEGERVLIIADGWDELSESQRSEGSFLYKLLFVQFPLMSVVVTSRPSASAPLHNLACIDRFVEIKGFGEDDITEYIRSEFPSDQEKAQRLLEQLEYNPLIESVCSVPLNCAIVCHLWHTLNEALPSTMTKLYKSIIMHFVCRNLRKTAAYGATFSMEGFDDLPEALQKSWWLLCEFAFKALERDQIVFSKQKLLEFFPKGNEDLLLFGLLQPVEEVLDLTSVVSYNFLHLTFMEYLAALHLSKQSLDSSMLKLLKNNRFDMVLRFYFGIRFCDSKGEADIDVVQQAIQCIKNKSSRWHCVFEAQNAIVNSEVQFDRFLDWPRNPHDCAAVLYVIASMQECSDLKIGFGYTGVRENQISELTDVLASKHGKLQVKKLFLSGNKLTDKTVSNLFNRASAAFHSFTLLDLVHNRIGAETIKSITTALAKSSSSKCKHIYLSNNPLEVSGLQALENAVREGVLPKLEVLDLTASLTGDADANASWLATFGEALSAHCPYLRRLNLSQNNLGVSGATALARVVSRLRQPHSSNVGGLAFLSLDQTNIGDEGLCAFVDSIEGVCHFDILYLNHNDIRATGVSCLTDAVCSGKVVIKMFFSCLHLHGNPLGLEGALAVGRMISSNRCQLDKLNLSRCMLTTVESSLWNVVPLNLAIGNNLSSEAVLDVQQLCQMPQNHSITMLGLNGTSFTGNGIHVLAAFMYLCPSLEDLHTISCGITSDDITKLFLILKSSFPDMLFGKLQSWFLQSNEIDNDGISALIGHLPSLFPSLFNIKISNNRTVSREVKEELDKELRRRKEFFSATRNSGDHELELTYILNISPWEIFSINAKITGPFLRPELQSRLKSSSNVELKRQEDFSSEPHPDSVTHPLTTSQSTKETSVERRGLNVSSANESTRIDADSYDKPDEELHTTFSQSPLDQVLDSVNHGVSKHLGQIADSMYEWEGSVAEQLGLTQAEVAAIKMEHHLKLNMQTRAALEKWKQKLGSTATYSNLIGVFERAGYKGYADTVRKVLLPSQASSHTTSLPIMEYATPTNQYFCEATSQECTSIGETSSTATTAAVCKELISIPPSSHDSSPLTTVSKRRNGTCCCNLI